MKIVIDLVKYQAYLNRRIVEKKIDRMTRKAELLLENAFRGSDMSNGAGAIPEAVKTPKVFELLVKQLTSASVLAEQLNGKSTGLVSLFIDKHQKEIEKKTEEKAVQSPVLAHALQEIVSALNQSLLEIANNLEKLENAW